MDRDKHDKIERILRELDKYPTQYKIEKAPYEFRAKRKFKPILTSG